MWHEDENLTISINNGIICCNDIEFNEISDFKKSIGIEILDIKSFVKILIDNTIDNKISDAKFNYLIYQKFDNKIDILEKYLFQNGYKMTKIGKGYEIKNNIIKTYELFKFLK